jgi:SAM-dependent methyltransferase
MTNMPATGGQAETDAKRSQPSAGQYLLAASEAEHARLIAAARRAAPTVREMCARAEVGAGARVVDVGCGPVGALLELAEIAGPGGAVVGLDSSAAAITTARAIVAGQGLRTVEVIHGDINTMDLAALTAGGPFDAAHLRLVLVHQVDPAATLRRVAALLRPEGRVLIVDVLAPPRYDPPVPASDRAWALLQAAGAARGLARHVGDRLPQLCADAGLRVLDARGSFSVPPAPRADLAVSRVPLLSTRAAIIDAGLASEPEIDLLAAELTAAEAQEFRSAVGYLIVQVIAAVPDGA